MKKFGFSNAHKEHDKTSPVFRFRITPDKMKAYVTVKKHKNGGDVSPEEILKAMEEYGVKYGINKKELERVCNLQSFSSEVFCAEGKEPVDGQDGTMKFHFERNPVLKPNLLEDGSTDYHDMGIIQSVDEEQLLCSRTKAIPGADGIDVFGDPIPFKPGKEVEFASGENTVISEDTLELRAAIDGCINYKNNIVSISDTFTVKGNVDISTGDIIFCGNVEVKGDVCEGFKVHAGKNVKIHGIVEGATVWAKGDITIVEGMNGMHSGKIYSGGNVKSRYFQNVDIMCQGDVSADYFLNGSVVSGGSIIAEKSKGLLLGGLYQAGKSIEAKVIGADSYLATDIEIKSSKEGFWDPETQKSKEEIEAELEKMSEEEKEQWLAEHAYTVPSAPDDAQIVVKTVAYPGVKLTIGQTMQKLDQEYYKVKFINGEEGIESCPI